MTYCTSFIKPKPSVHQLVIKTIYALERTRSLCFFFLLMLFVMIRWRIIRICVYSNRKSYNCQRRNYFSKTTHLKIKKNILKNTNVTKLTTNIVNIYVQVLISSSIKHTHGRELGSSPCQTEMKRSLCLLITIKHIPKWWQQ